MAANTKTKADSTEHSEAKAMPSAFSGLTMGEADKAPKISRGRKSSGPVPEVIFCRQALEDSIKNEKLKTFEGVDPDRREFFARYIRAAANLEGNEHESFTHSGQIELETRYDKSTKTLYFGPAELVRRLASADTSDSDS